MLSTSRALPGPAMPGPAILAPRQRAITARAASDMPAIASTVARSAGPLFKPVSPLSQTQAPVRWESNGTWLEPSQDWLQPPDESIVPVFDCQSNLDLDELGKVLCEHIEQNVQATGEKNRTCATQNLCTAHSPDQSTCNVAAAPRNKVYCVSASLGCRCLAARKLLYCMSWHYNSRHIAALLAKRMAALRAARCRGADDTTCAAGCMLIKGLFGQNKQLTAREFGALLAAAASHGGWKRRRCSPFHTFSSSYRYLGAAVCKSSTTRVPAGSRHSCAATPACAGPQQLVACC